MRTVVVGYGSIGSRHARLLKGLGCDVSIVSRRDCSEFCCHKTISAAVKLHQPEYVVLAHETALHHRDLTELADTGFKGIVLAEKPLFHTALLMPHNSFSNTFIAYNLRFHPLMQKLYDILGNERIISAQVYAGQYLPEWRPGRDYRQTYSSNGNDGGVLRDLSHELDYILWFFGKWQRVAAIGGHYSHLEIDSDDCFSLLISTVRCPAVLLQMNYLDRTGRRAIIINTDTKSIILDLISGTLRINNETEVSKTGRDDTYTNQHRAVLEGNYSHICTVEEGMQVMQLIEAAETAATNKVWISQ